ncbi:PAS domain S-box protein [Desulfococcaceae bacterium HSG7]|nr:PAS domain S-box protein [Desulfococcaceae bacterium HSG7]
MPKKPTYEELEQKIAELENKFQKYKADHPASKDDERPGLGDVFLDLINVMDIAMWELDMDYRVVSSNRKAKEIYGEEVTGSFCYFAASGENAVCSNCPAKAIYNGHESGRSEHLRTAASGKTIYIDHIATPIRDKTGKLTGVLVLIIDITERKLMEEEIRRHRDRLDELVRERTRELLKSEKALREKEQRYRALFEHTNDAVFFISPDNICLDANRQAADMLGYEIDELIGISVQNLVAPNKYSETRRQPVYEPTIRKKDGAELPADIDIAIIHDIRGNPLHTQIVMHDITERKLAEEKINLYKDIFQHSLDGIAVIDLQGNYLEQNPSHRDLIGYSDEDLQGKTPAIHFGDEAFMEIGRILEEQGKLRGDFVSHSKAGRKIHLDLSAFTVTDDHGNAKCHVGIKRDITERKQAEEAVKQSEHKLAAHIKLIPMGVIEFNNEFEITSWNPEAEKIFGYTKEEAIGSNTFDLLVPEYEYDSVRKIHHLSEPKSNENINDNKTKDGKLITCHWFNTPILNTDGELAGMTAVCQDISEKLKVEKEIKLLRKRLDNIINSMPSALIGVETDGLITDWNYNATEITGISANDAIGKLFIQILPQYDGQLKKIKTAIRNKHPETTHKLKRYVNDAVCYEDITIYPLIANGVEGAVIRIDDVTEQVRMEEMMVQSEKMLSVGGLAAGMAHEINNPLAGMMQTADNMSNRLTNINLPANQRAAEAAGVSLDAIRAFMESRGILRMIATINESGRRIAEIVDNMLNFARKSDSSVSSYQLDSLLDRTLVLASTDYDLKKQYDFKAIKIVKEYENNLPYTPCEGAKIQQVFLNIFSNGAQAMQEADTEKPAFMLRVRYEKERGMVCIEIEDNGPGMDETICKRIFEPFFTTKPVGEGTGLGLSVSYFIITESCGGEMCVESTPGKGAKFIIRLPLEFSDIHNEIIYGLPE